MTRKVARPWSPEDDARLKELIGTKMTYDQIGKALGRNPGSVCSHVSALGWTRRAVTKESTGRIRGTIIRKGNVTIHLANYSD